MVESYLERNTLVFDRELLTKMFTEADYQKEGSLDTRALTIAISGRFPKREHTADWRGLVCMLLGLPELVLTDDPEMVLLRTTTERLHSGRGAPGLGGTYNSGNIWDNPPPPLPPVHRRSSSSGKAKAKEPSPEWQDTMNRTASATGAGSASGTGSLTGTGTLTALGGNLNATMRSGSAGGVLDASGALGSSSLMVGGVVGTTGGLKQVGQIADELRLNAALLGSSGNGLPGEAAGPRSTFGTVRDFNDFARGLEMLPRLAADSGTAGLGPGSGSASADASPRTATHLGAPKDPVRVWAAPLPPSAISLPASALRTLRESVRSTASTKPDFERSFKPLDSHDLDLKRTLGQGMDMEKSLARVEPVRDTKVLPRADYVTWCDYAAGCRTAPTGWYERHPAAAAQDTGDHKYPWC
ncbi:hypothetical protein GPECTOR_14g83 [Gonium pectorale]|uniref:Uncharacterized protein n=1 Tax=Gonium pectorale TaxID=33097 RepID=A0A150GMT2_GONPE|nr:hypothetical protein GPECTOR_14g83 [Gonium pectorale]|eukprot:KXZ51101.1 hypothetical protein GPECTOR_14g83 [Gonium pectorale]